jgi:hypothetical protein
MTVDREERGNFCFVGFCGTSELSLFERKRELADKKDGFDIGFLLQQT